ncbi:MAG: SDR family NAD(P)-dependent oxidoreductase, partial [Rhodoferax sp.]
MTGASCSVGATIARRLTGDGFNVVINYSRDAAPADALNEAHRQRGAEAIAHPTDVSDAVAVKSLFDAAESAFGGIDVLINSASTMRLSPWAETD